MPLFTFYCCKPDGAATALEAHELESDERVMDRAQRVLWEHGSCAHVTVFDEEREVLTVRRSAELDERRPGLSITPKDSVPLPRA